MRTWSVDSLSAFLLKRLVTHPWSLARARDIPVWCSSCQRQTMACVPDFVQTIDFLAGSSLVCVCRPRAGWLSCMRPFEFLEERYGHRGQAQH